ncbi:MAG TPA: TrkA C-terminal domain-containing protein [Gammaproteobacteria bacterium]|nr:TrkA C-terminal domain-containing protein [Gammaproteobacteria bacterium]
MTAVISLLLILVLSVVITRVSTIALMHTGLSLETARFQARSAFTGAGFTTNESERIVTHPVRRRIIMALMMVGNAGLVTAVASLMLTFIGDQTALGTGMRITLIVVGVTALWSLTMSQWVEQKLSMAIEWALRRYTQMDVQDYAALMHIADDYRISELAVSASDWLCDKSLRDSNLRNEGLIVLGIERPDGSYLGAPQPDTVIEARDRLLIYGRAKNLEELDKRRRDAQGDLEHEKAVAQHALQQAPD